MKPGYFLLFSSNVKDAPGDRRFSLEAPQLVTAGPASQPSPSLFSLAAPLRLLARRLRTTLHDTVNALRESARCGKVRKSCRLRDAVSPAAGERESYSPLQLTRCPTEHDGRTPVASARQLRQTSPLSTSATSCRAPLPSPRSGRGGATWPADGRGVQPSPQVQASPNRRGCAMPCPSTRMTSGTVRGALEHRKRGPRGRRVAGM